MRVVVTGNEGYIGSVLTARLVELGFEVLGIDNGAWRNVALTERVRPTVQLYKDVREVEKNDLVGADAIIHLAALSNDPVGELNPEVTLDINYRASVRLAELARGVGVRRFLFSSSCSMYGVSDQGLVGEEAELDPRTVYAKSKVLVEQEVRKMSDDSFVSVFLRNATVFGPSPRLRLDLVVNDLAAGGFVEGVIRVLSDGTPWRPLLHVRDCAEAFIFLLTAPEDGIRGQAFNIGAAANNLQVRDVAERVGRVVPGARVEISGAASADERTYRVDFSKIAELGWSQGRSVEEGARELVDVFQEAAFDSENYAADRFYTLRYYQRLIDEQVMDEDMRVHANAIVKP